MADKLAATLGADLGWERVTGVAPGQTRRGVSAASACRVARACAAAPQAVACSSGGVRAARRERAQVEVEPDQPLVQDRNGGMAQGGTSQRSGAPVAVQEGREGAARRAAPPPARPS